MRNSELFNSQFRILLFNNGLRLPSNQVMRTRPQRIALSRIVNTVITKSPEKTVVVSSASESQTPPEDVNPWEGKTIRIGYAPFLSHIPITNDLEQTANENNIPVEISQKASFAEVLDEFLNERLDVALLSMADYFRRPESFISSDVCICSEGMVRSFLLYGRVQPYQIKTIATYQVPQTCTLMAQILLAEQYRIYPKIITLDETERWELSEADAVLLTGNRALRQPPRGDRFSFIWDMGQRWTQWTGVPFVYTFWLSRDKYLGRYIAPSLAQTRDKGLEKLPELAIQGARQFRIEPEFTNDYLCKKISYRLSGRQRKGIEIFCRLAKKHLLIDIGSTTPFNSSFRFRKRDSESEALKEQEPNQEDFNSAAT